MAKMTDEQRVFIELVRDLDMPGFILLIFYVYALFTFYVVRRRRRNNARIFRQLRKEMEEELIEETDE
ncbi:unnamed protein product [Danaus chrysippus]|uniref:(African queen) hypothetical protein n=1 Tax=Danaus chrysippus TaxID=151541 RepID=A0A8J2MHP9_9NEOP|nr:unnamed protein product [Danaus chrysippus]